MLGNGMGGDLDRGQVAELPQFRGGARILEDHPVDVEGVQFAGPVVVDLADRVVDKSAELFFVVSGDALACARCSALVDTSRVQWVGRLEREQGTSASGIPHGRCELFGEDDFHVGLDQYWGVLEAGALVRL